MVKKIAAVSRLYWQKYGSIILNLPDWTDKKVLFWWSL